MLVGRSVEVGWGWARLMGQSKAKVRVVNKICSIIDKKGR
jgi:hypothetical protein